ncbi:hypothetical protein LCGC14_2831620, partial [marine sediment metagenome]
MPRNTVEIILKAKDQASGDLKNVRVNIGGIAKVAAKSAAVVVAATGAMTAGIFALASAIVLALVHFIMSQMVKRQRAEERLSNAIDAIDDGFALYDRHDRFVTCNRKYREFYSLSADLFVPGTRFEDIIREGVSRGQYPDAIGDEDAWIAERLNRHRCTDNIIVQKLAGGRWLKIAERKTSDGGTVGFRVDITELTEARDFAERASRAKTDFINVLSHELRTPMTVVLGYTSILANPLLFRAAREFETALDAPDSNPDLLRRRGGALLAEMSKRHPDHPGVVHFIIHSYDDPELPHVYDSWASRIHPDDYERVMKDMKAHLEEGKIYDVD